jgi:hypothetical protein
MTVSYIGLSAVGWHAMWESWWNKVCVACPRRNICSHEQVIGIFLLATIVLGALYLIFRLILSLRAYWAVSSRDILVANRTYLRLYDCRAGSNV